MAVPQERNIAFGQDQRSLREGGTVSHFELRVGDPRRDAEALTFLFTQPSSIEHLAGVAPRPLTESEKSFLNYRYTNVPIMIATPGEITRYYKSHPDLVLIVAETRSGEIAGTITVQQPGLGMLAAQAQRLVVAEEYRGEHLGGKLINGADAYMFGLLNCRQVNAAVILGINGDGYPQRVFRNEHYVSRQEERGRCVSWGIKEGRFVERNVLPMLLERNDYSRHHYNHVQRDIPSGLQLSSPEGPSAA